MPKPRFSGGSVSMRVSSSHMLPPESGRRPAMQLSAVDLPQPEGPRSAMNSPRLMIMVSSSSALKALPPVPAKRRVTWSSLSSWKSCFMYSPFPRRACDRPDREREPSVVRRTPLGPRLGGDEMSGRTFSFRLLRADLLIPDAECFDLRLGLERLGVREFLEPALVLGAPVLLDCVLTFLRGHRKRHVLD